MANNTSRSFSPLVVSKLTIIGTLIFIPATKYEFFVLYVK